jgi:hypothetical protein
MVLFSPRGGQRPGKARTQKVQKGNIWVYSYKKGVLIGGCKSSKGVSRLRSLFFI